MKQKLKTMILPVLVISFLFLLWECWNRQVYIETGNFPEDIKKYLSGFSKPDKRCMGWLFVHIPVQCYLVIKQSDFMRKFAVLWYFRNKNLRFAFWGFYKLYWKVPFSYYFFGLIVIYLKKLLFRVTDTSWEKMLIFCFFFSLILTLNVMAVCALAFLCFLFLKNYQAAFSLIFLVEVSSVMFCSRTIENGASFSKYWYMPFIGMIVGQADFAGGWNTTVLFTEILKIVIVLEISIMVFHKKYDSIMGTDE